MSEMVDRIAQVEFSLDRKFIGTQSRPIAETWDALSAEHKELYRTRARANIAAMREPIEGMVKAGDFWWSACLENMKPADENAQIIYRAMIDAALT